MSIARTDKGEERAIVNLIPELDSPKGVAGSSSTCPTQPPEENINDRFWEKRPDETPPAPPPAPPVDDSAARARQAADQAIGTVKDTAREAAAGIKDAVREAGQKVKDQARGVMDDAQTKAADQTRTAANTLRDAAGGLNGELPWMKTALHKTADGFDHLTNALNRGDVGQALDAVKDFARRQPALFMGLSVAAGFALARVGKTALDEMKPADDESQERSELTLTEAVGPYAPTAEI